MEQVQFNFPLTKEQEEQRQKRFEKLKNSETMRQWLKRNRCDEHFLWEHSIKMEQLLTRYETCQSCQGLHQCAYAKKGYVLDLTFEQVLLEQLTPCRYMRKKMQELAHLQNYRYCDLSEAQLLINLETLDVSKESNDYKTMLKQVVLSAFKKQKGVYLYGKPGVGKTYLAAGIANHFAKQGQKVAFVNVVRLIQDLKGMFGDSDAIAKRMELLMRVPVLVLDDLGGENITKWSRDEILLPLLGARMEAGLFTCFTSNYQYGDLQRQYQYASGIEEEMNALRFLERVKALSCEIFVKGSSRR